MDTKKPNTTLNLPDGRRFEGQPLGMTVAAAGPTFNDDVVLADACGNFGRLLSNFHMGEGLTLKQRAARLLLDSLGTHLAYLTRQEDTALAAQLIGGFRGLTQKLDDWVLEE